MFSHGKVDIGVHAASLDKKADVRPLYNWLLKAVKNGYHVYRFNVTDVDGEMLLQPEAVHVLDNEHLKGLRKLLDLLVENHEKALEGFQEKDASSLELEILGPTYLIKG
jgi:hypothetical protein